MPLAQILWLLCYLIFFVAAAAAEQISIFFLFLQQINVWEEKRQHTTTTAITTEINKRLNTLFNVNIHCVRAALLNDHRKSANIRYIFLLLIFFFFFLFGYAYERELDFGKYAIVSRNWQAQKLTLNIDCWFAAAVAATAVTVAANSYMRKEVEKWKLGERKPTHTIHINIYIVYYFVLKLNTHHFEVNNHSRAILLIFFVSFSFSLFLEFSIYFIFFFFFLTPMLFSACAERYGMARRSDCDVMQNISHSASKRPSHTYTVKISLLSLSGLLFAMTCTAPKNETKR